MRAVPGACTAHQFGVHYFPWNIGAKHPRKSPCLYHDTVHSASHELESSQIRLQIEDRSIQGTTDREIEIY